MVQWWCRLEQQEVLQDLGLTGLRARALGIQAWVINVEVGADGSLLPALPLEKLLAAADSGGPQLCLMLQLSQSLSPSAEKKLAVALAHWLVQPMAALMAGRPVLLIENHNGLSHQHYGVERLRLTLQWELWQKHKTLKKATPWLIGLPGPNWECSLIEPQRTCDKYIQNLRQVHQGPWPTGVHIPIVHAPNKQSCGGTEKLYSEWLEQAGAVSTCYRNGASDAVVLIESWHNHRRNWRSSSIRSKSSAQLQPRIRDKFVIKYPAASTTEEWGETNAKHLALLVHGFYPDLLANLLLRLPQQTIEPEIDLYISTPFTQMDQIANLLKEQGWQRVRLFGVENRGRDIAPFLLKLMPCAVKTGHRYFIKIHTKLSNHLSDGDLWSAHLAGSLLSPGSITYCLQKLELNNKLGLLAPAGTLVPLSLNLQPSVSHLIKLCKRTSINAATLLQQHFIAGSMMAGRLEAIQQIYSLGLELENFEAEAGQTDGTLAHALERWLCIAAANDGWQLGELPGDSRAVPGFGYR